LEHAVSTTQPTQTSDVIRFLNETENAGQLAEHFSGRHAVAETIVAQRSSLGGVFRNVDDVISAVGKERFDEISEVVRRRGRTPAARPEEDRTAFRSLILQNPNYFGNLEISPYKPVKLLQTNTNYEQLTCLGLNPPLDRLEAVLQVKQQTGYGGDISSLGTFE